MDHKLLTTVRSDHVKQKQLCEKLIDETDPDRRKQIRNDLCLELHAHLKAEETSFFAVLQKSGDQQIRQDALESLRNTISMKSP